MTWATVYLICFIAGFSFSVLSLLGGMGRVHLPLPKHLHLHLPHGVAGHAGRVAVLHSSSTHSGVHSGRSAAVPGSPNQAPFFNFFTVTAFLAWFGGTGYILTAYSSLLALAAFGVATAAGLTGAGAVFWFFAKVLAAHEKALDPADYRLIGVLGRVSISIRDGGTGEIIFSQAGARRACGARSDDGKAIAREAEVVITRYERGIAYVRRWEDLAGDSGIVSAEPGGAA